MYYLGDNFSSYSYENCDGGDHQVNDSHIIELLAAMSVVNFDNKQYSFPIATQFHEFGLANTPKQNASVIFSDFGPASRKVIQKPLSIMAILNSYLNNRDIEQRLSQKWAKDKKSKLGADFFESEFFVNYDSFKKDFEYWIDELSRNQMSFKPFNSDADLRKEDGLNKVIGIKPSYPGINPFRKKGYDLIDEKLGDNLRLVQGNLSSQDTFMELFYTTLSEISKENLKI